MNDYAHSSLWARARIDIGKGRRYTMVYTYCGDCGAGVPPVNAKIT